jgi:hypothetical protein
MVIGHAPFETQMDSKQVFAAASQQRTGAVTLTAAHSMTGVPPTGQPSTRSIKRRLSVGALVGTAVGAAAGAAVGAAVVGASGLGGGADGGGDGGGGLGGGGEGGGGEGRGGIGGGDAGGGGEGAVTRAVLTTADPGAALTAPRPEVSCVPFADPMTAPASTEAVSLG